VAGALGLQFAGIYLPFLNDLLKTRPLTALDLLVVFALSTLGYAAIRLDRVLHRDGQWRPSLRRRRPGALGQESVPDREPGQRLGLDRVTGQASPNVHAAGPHGQLGPGRRDPRDERL
jgi:hypothetical protein